MEWPNLACHVNCPFLNFSYSWNFCHYLDMQPTDTVCSLVLSLTASLRRVSKCHIHIDFPLQPFSLPHSAMVWHKCTWSFMYLSPPRVAVMYDTFLRIFPSMNRAELGKAKFSKKKKKGNLFPFSLFPKTVEITLHFILVNELTNTFYDC